VAAVLQFLAAIDAAKVNIVPPEPTPTGPQGDVENPKGTNLGWEASPRIERRSDDGGA